MVPGPGAWRTQSGEKPHVLLGALEEANEKGPYRRRLAGAAWGRSLPEEGEGPAAPPPGCLFLPFPPHHAWHSRICQESSGNNLVSTGRLFCGVSVGQWGQAASLQAGSSAEPSGSS